MTSSSRMPRRQRQRRRAISASGGRVSVTTRGSMLALDDHLLDLRDRLRRIEILRAGLRAVHDRVATVETERVLELVEALAGGLVARVDDPAIRREQRRRAEEPVTVPPIRRATGRAARAEDARGRPV